MSNLFAWRSSSLHRWILGFGLAAAPVLGHPNGTSNTTIRLVTPDSLEMAMNVNHDDLMNVLGFHAGIQYGRQITAKQAAIFDSEAQDYFRARVRLKVDDRLLDGLHVISWKPGGKGPADDFTDDSAYFWRANFDITLAGVLPPHSQNLNVAVQMFAEFGIQAISRVALYWKDSLVEEHWIGLDQTINLPLNPDTLNAMLRAQKIKPEKVAAPNGNLTGHFLFLGFQHVLTNGLDYILFVLGLYFFATGLRPLLLQFIAYSAALSLTLWLSMAGALSLTPRIVEPLMALSIAVVGLENLFFRKVSLWRWCIVFGLGLVHGLGLAAALGQLGGPEIQLGPTLAGFNVGVELGLLAVVVIALALTRWFWSKPWYFKRIALPASAAITVVALYWVVRRTMGAL